MSRTVVNYFRTECRMLREYLKRQHYYQLKTKELDHNLTSLHSAMTDRVSTTTSHSMPTFNFELAGMRDECDTLSGLYRDKIKHIIDGIQLLPIWIRPDFIRAYVMETPMRDISESTGKHVVNIQKEFYTAVSDFISESWMNADKRIIKKIDDAEKNMSANIRYNI